MIRISFRADRILVCSLVIYITFLFAQLAFSEVVQVSRRKNFSQACYSVFEIPLHTWILCADICSRLAICKSAYFQVDLKICQINYKYDNVYSTEGGSLIEASKIPTEFYGECKNHLCKVDEICMPRKRGYSCKPIVLHEKGWIRYKEHLYYYSRRCDSWEGAQKQCREKNSNLVKIDDEEENTWLSNMVKGKEFMGTWIGAYRKEHLGQWLWISDNKTMEYTDYFYERKEYKANCLYLSPSTMHWEMLKCFNSYTFICER